MISTLFSSLNTNTEDTLYQLPKEMQPLLIVMQNTMPLFKEIGELFINEPATIEVRNLSVLYKQPCNILIIFQALCSALKHAITNLLNDFRPMLPDLCCLIISILQSKCVPPAIDIAKTVCVFFFQNIFTYLKTIFPFLQCIILFYRDEQCRNIMRQLLMEVILYNFRLFEVILHKRYA